MIGVNCGGTMSPVPTMQMIKDVYGLDPDKVVKEEIRAEILLLKQKMVKKKDLILMNLKMKEWVGEVIVKDVT